MSPIELLSEEEKENLKTYIEYCSGVDMRISIDDFLKDWSKAKRTLCKALGNKLRVEIPVEENTFQNNDYLFRNNLQGIYHYIPFLMEDYNCFKNSSRAVGFCHCVGNTFIELLIQYLCKELDYSTVFSIWNLFQYSIIFSQKANREFKFKLHGHKIVVQNDSKPMRVIGKIVAIISAEHPYDITAQNLERHFDLFRNAISDLHTRDTRLRSITISIHPLDILTASQNNSNWTSCFNFLDGGYRASVLELLNSNCAAIVYAKDEKPMSIAGVKFDSKCWRAFMYVNKNITVVSRNYPHYLKDVSRFALSSMEKLLWKNLHWKYQYRNELFKDMRYNIYKRTKTDSHVISFFINEYQYNDFSSCINEEYWCSRNYVDKKNLRITMGGKAKCVCCGKPLEDVDADMILCYHCADFHPCECCDGFYPHEEIECVYFGLNDYRDICSNCITDLYFNPENGEASFYETEKYSLDYWAAKSRGLIDN